MFVALTRELVLVDSQHDGRHMFTNVAKAKDSLFFPSRNGATCNNDDTGESKSLGRVLIHSSCFDFDCQDFKVGSLFIVVDVKKAESVDTSALATARLAGLKIEYRERTLSLFRWT
jgi:hypothetical protein